MRVYLSGPVTGLPHGEAHAAFEEAAGALAAAGHSVWSPVDNVPAGTGHERAMAICLHALTSWRLWETPFDALVLMHGWERSEGCRAELAVARACGIRAMGIDEALRDGELSG